MGRLPQSRQKYALSVEEGGQRTVDTGQRHHQEKTDDDGGGGAQAAQDGVQACGPTREDKEEREAMEEGTKDAVREVGIHSDLVSMMRSPRTVPHLVHTTSPEEYSSMSSVGIWQ